MALTDEYSFTADAGKGGDGVVRWRREKFRPKGGPAGGDGGKGGDVLVEGIRDTMILGRIAHKDSYHANDGEPGGKNSMTGADAEDLVIKLPLGSVVTNTDTDEAVELLTEGEHVRLLQGGVGGYGNEYFKSSTNQRPEQCTKGKEGESGSYHVELRLIADIGLAGLPNAGKSSLLNALTNADAKVGEYPFTTLDPNLGVYHKYIIADIPGLIEGASEGKGLGHKFLRHISRTRVILHCISLERDDVVNTYNVVRNELAAYPSVLEKNEYVLFTKSDLCTDDEAAKKIESFKKKVQVEILGMVTILDDESVKDLGDALVKLLRTK